VFLVIKSCYFDDAIDIHDGEPYPISFERTHTFDDTIQSWIDTNIPIIDSVTIEEMGSFAVDIQQRVFYLMSPPIKKEMWKNRLTSAEEHLTSGQISHLTTLEGILDGVDFVDSLSDGIISDVNDWKVDAVAYHSWDSLGVVQLLKSFTPLDELPTIFAMVGPIDSIDDSDEWCNCRRDIFCRWLTLDTPRCIDKNCKRIRHCGLWMFRECTGRCHK